jgi:hypothetical protein
VLDSHWNDSVNRLWDLNIFADQWNSVNSSISLLEISRNTLNILSSPLMHANRLENRFELVKRWNKLVEISLDAIMTSSIFKIFQISLPADILIDLFNREPQNKYLYPIKFPSSFIRELIQLHGKHIHSLFLKWFFDLSKTTPILESCHFLSLMFYENLDLCFVSNRLKTSKRRFWCKKLRIFSSNRFRDLLNWCGSLKWAEFVFLTI